MRGSFDRLGKLVSRSRNALGAAQANSPRPRPLPIKGRGEEAPTRRRRVASKSCGVLLAERVLIASSLSLISSIAFAQQTAVSCEVADFTMTMRLYLPLTPGPLGSPGSDPMQGTLEIHHQKVPKERRLWSLDGKRPAQFWNQGGELKMLLVLGTGDDAISIVIETAQRQSETEHTGAFRLLAPGVKLTGKLACVVG